MEQIWENQWFFALRWSILCRPTYLHRLPFCNITHWCESPLYVDKVFKIHTWIQSGHMHVHMCTCMHTCAQKVHMCVVLNFWVTCTVSLRSFDYYKHGKIYWANIHGLNLTKVFLQNTFAVPWPEVLIIKF